MQVRDTYKYAATAARMLGSVALAFGVATTSFAQSPIGEVDDTVVVAAREALRTRNLNNLTLARDQLIMSGHPLAPWADYWQLTLRWETVSPSEVDAFLARWPDAYVADRARNDWLLELGKRQDWSTFLRIHPQFRMADDREVNCSHVLARYQTQPGSQSTSAWRAQAQRVWWDQTDADGACDRMASSLLQAGVLTSDDVWRKLRFLVEANKPKGVQQTARHLGDALSSSIGTLMTEPAAILLASGSKATLSQSRTGALIATKRFGGKPNLESIPLTVPDSAEGALNLLAFIRWASLDHPAAAAAMNNPSTRSQWQWRAEEAAWAWAQLGRTAAWRLLPDATDYYTRALTDVGVASGAGELQGAASTWSPLTLEWMVRSAIRVATAGDGAKWALVEQAVAAMSPEQRADPAWQYWQARALLARPVQSAAITQQARALMAQVVDPLTFYGQLAAVTLNGRPPVPPAMPAPVTAAELSAAEREPGIARSLHLLALGWRSEAVREWNFTLRRTKPGGLTDRELLAVAEVACRREIWDRCINTSERTKQVVNLAQRYPTPFRQDILAAAGEVGLDPAYMYGLIRQESRFLITARSTVGASGLMQVMPATASWTAKKLGIPYSPDMLTERSTNLRIGAGYLKLLQDDFEGNQALAAAAYNAGPGRPRRWREGVTLESAAWAENVPFAETRDYVKKVLANATVYAHLLRGQALNIQPRLGSVIGPRSLSAPGVAGDLP